MSLEKHLNMHIFSIIMYQKYSGGRKMGEYQISNKIKILVVLIIIFEWILVGALLTISITNNISILYGGYEIHWSGTTAEKYKVNDSRSGDFECFNLFDFDTNLLFEHKTDDPNSLKIKLWINIDDLEKPYLYKYEIEADYSFANVTDIHELIPCKINGSGHGEWDWKDKWKIKIYEFIPPKAPWGLKDFFILGNLFFSLSAGSVIIFIFFKKIY